MKKLLTKIFISTIVVINPFMMQAQNQVSKSGFFKSLLLDPVITLHNKSAMVIECIIIDYKIDGKQSQKYKFGGSLPANTSVDIPLPRMQVSNGMHFFDASVSTSSGEPLKDKTFAEGLSFTISPGAKVTSGKQNKAEKEEEKEANKPACSCQNGEGLDEDISFWFSVYINDRQQLDAFGSTNQGVIWFPGKWEKRAGLENDLNHVVFADPANKNRTYVLNVSTQPVAENFTNYGITQQETYATELNYFNSKAYPNPFSDRVNIEYTIIQNGNIDIIISDLSGKIVDRPVLGLTHGKGKYTYQYNTSKLSQGVYYCTIRYDNKKQTIKLVKK